MPVRPSVGLIDASPADLTAVRRQVGFCEARDGEADVVVRFVDRLPSGSAVELLTDGAGERWQVNCRRGQGHVPLLTEAVRLAAVGSGLLPVHAAAFALDGAGVAVTGWSGSGKTGALLTFLFRGARYVASEWVLVDDSGRMHGISQPVRIREWHLRELPQLWSSVTRGDRMRLRLLRAARGADRLSGGRIGARLHVDVQPDRLTTERAPDGPPLHRLFVMEAADNGIPEVLRLDPQGAVERVVAILEYDLLDVRAECLRARALGRRALDEVVDRLQEQQRRLAHQRLADHEVLLVRHVHPGSLSAVFAAMRPHVETRV